MKKIIYTVFLLLSMNLFCGQKLQELKPEFETLVSTSMTSFEALMRQAIGNEFSSEFSGHFLVNSNKYSNNILQTTIQPNAKLSDFLKASGENIPDDSVIRIKLEETETNHFLFTLDSGDNPEVIEGDFEYMKTLLPFLVENIKTMATYQ